MFGGRSVSVLCTWLGADGLLHPTGVELPPIKHLIFHMQPDLRQCLHPILLLLYVYVEAAPYAHLNSISQLVLSYPLIQ
jgi:hypothetical protein